MKTFYSLNDFLKSRVSPKKFVVTIGVFDGVHRAHQKIVEILAKEAKKNHLATLLITFDPHPANILQKSARVPLLISLSHRLRLLKEMGLDYVIVLRFDEKLYHMSAAHFINKVLAKIRISEIIIGRNFFFGRNKKGTITDLKRSSEIYGYKVKVVTPFRHSGKVISSTWIRSLILKGDLKKSSRLLSRPVTVLGTVMKGYKRGRIIGCPTANIDPHHEAIPPSGVYAVKLKLKNKLYKGVLNIGRRPTFKKNSKDRESTIEAHIFNFNKSIYGKDLEIMFVKKIRKEKRFRDTSSLREQIERDKKLARRILR